MMKLLPPYWLAKVHKFCAAHSLAIPAFWACLLAAILFFFVLTHCQPIYGTNDDVGMMFIASGVFDGCRDAHIIFSNYLIGIFLVGLYTIDHTINWYAMYLYAVHSISLAILFYSILCGKHRLRNLLLAGSVFFLFWAEMLLLLTFTTTAFVAFIAGLSCLVRSCSSPKLGTPRQFAMLAIIAFSLAAMVRFDVFIMGMVLSLPILLWYLLKCPKHRAIRVLLIGAIGIFAISITDWGAYQFNQGWRDYRAYNRIRGKIHGTPRDLWSNGGPERLRQIGFSMNDMDIFFQWNFYDLNVFSLSRLQNFDSNFPAAEMDWNKVRTQFVAICQERNAQLGFILINCILALALSRRRLWMSTIIAVSILIALSMALSLIHFARFPERIYMPLLLSLAIMPFIMLFGEGMHLYESGKQQRLNRLVAIIAVMLVIPYYGRQIYQSVARISKDSRAAGNEIYWNTHATQLKLVLQKYGKQPGLVVVGGSLPFSAISLFSNAADLRALKLIPGGWLTHSPVYNRVLAQIGIKDVYQILYETDKLLLLCPNRDETRTLSNFIVEHYHQPVQFMQLGSLPHSLIAKLTPLSEIKK